MTTDTQQPAAEILAWCDEVEALAAKVTPGPWFQMWDSDGDESGVYPDPIATTEVWRECGVDAEFLFHTPTEDDAEFIAASRTLVPLLARRLRTAVEALESARVFLDSGHDKLPYDDDVSDYDLMGDYAHDARYAYPARERWMRERLDAALAALKEDE